MCYFLYLGSQNWLIKLIPSSASQELSPNSDARLNSVTAYVLAFGATSKLSKIKFLNLQFSITQKKTKLTYDHMSYFTKC